MRGGDFTTAAWYSPLTIILRKTSLSHFEKVTVFMSDVHSFFHFCVLVGVIVLNTVIPRTTSIRFYAIVILLVEALAEFFVPNFVPNNATNIIYTLRISTLAFIACCFILSAFFTKETKNVKKNTKDLGPHVSLKYPKRTYGNNTNIDQYQIPVYCGAGDTTPEKSVSLPIIEYHKKHLSKIDLTSNEFAKRMDQNSTTYKKQFFYPENTIYLCGNSLGLQPRSLPTLIQGELEKWAGVGVKGHFQGDYPWFNIEDYLAEKMAKVVGAKTVEVAVMNTLTTNLHALMIAFYRPTETRSKILIEESPFPSDMHAITTHVVSRDLDPEKVIVQIGARKGEEYLRTQDVINLIQSPLGDELAVVMIAGIHFMTGQFFDLQKITKIAHEKGIIIGFDLAHVAGNLDIKLHDWDVDFACWCTYKYLNSGPGNIGGIFVHERFAKCTLNELPRFSGWWGHKRETRFTLTNKFDPQEGAAGFQCSNPPILGCMSLIASLDVFNQTDMTTLRAKSVLLTSYLEHLLSQKEWNSRIKILTPSDPERRGCQISIRVLKHPIKSVMELLEEKGVVCDEREPDIIRIAPTPLYNTFEDVYSAVNVLREAFNTLENQPTNGEKKENKKAETGKAEKKTEKKTEKKSETKKKN
jgi:kynureninase